MMLHPKNAFNNRLSKQDMTDILQGLAPNELLTYNNQPFGANYRAAKLSFPARAQIPTRSSFGVVDS